MVVTVYVYFVQAESGPVKIGIAKNPESRLYDLQAGNHEKLTLLATVPGGRTVELVLHERFEDARIHREWFRLTPELSDLIASLMRDKIPDWLKQWTHPQGPPMVDNIIYGPVQRQCSDCQWPVEAERIERGHTTCWTCAKEVAAK